MSDGEESGDDKFRGVCKHGVEQTRTWRGPVRDSYADAQQDIDITIKPMVIHAITALCFSLAILITTTIDHSKMFSVWGNLILHWRMEYNAAAWLFVSALGGGLGLIGKSTIGLEKLDKTIQSV